MLKTFLPFLLLVTIKSARSEIVITEKAPTTPKEMTTLVETSEKPTAKDSRTTLATTSLEYATENGFETRPPHNTQKIRPVHSLKDLCKLFEIDEENCTCALFNNTIETFCGKDPTPSIRILNYNPSMSRPYAVVSLISCLVALLGNAAVITVKYKRKPISHSRLLITELATSDFVFAILQLLITVPLFWTNAWLYGRVMCKVLHSAQTLAVMYSIGFILLISIERYYGILNGSQAKKISRRVLHGLTVTSFLIGLICIVPLLMFLDVDPELNKCLIFWPQNSVDSLTYNMFITIFYIAIPAITICVLYSRITSYLWNETRNNYALHCGDKTMLSRRMADNKRVAYILIAILLAFVVCVLPSHLSLIYMNWMDNKISKTTFFILNYIALIPYPLHLAVNPIVYSLIDKRWRQEIWLVLTCTTEHQQGIRLSESMKRSRSTSVSSAKSYNAVRFGSGKDDKGRNLSVDMGTNLLSSSFKDDVFKF